MKPTEKSDDDYLLQSSDEIMKTQRWEKANIGSSDITTTVALLAHRWQRQIWVVLLVGRAAWEIYFNQSEALLIWRGN